MDVPIRFECVNCLLDFSDPFCDSCGAALSEHPLYANPYAAPDDATERNVDAVECTLEQFKRDERLTTSTSRPAPAKSAGGSSMTKG
jgi:hypothetical protein